MKINAIRQFCSYRFLICFFFVCANSFEDLQAQNVEVNYEFCGAYSGTYIQQDDENGRHAYHLPPNTSSGDVHLSFSSENNRWEFSSGAWAPDNGEMKPPCTGWTKGYICGVPIITSNCIDPKEPPVVSHISNVSVACDQSGSASVSVTDDDCSKLSFSASSNNTELIDNGGLSFSGSGCNRTLSLNPNTYKDGSATITVTVNDAQDASFTQTKTFTYTVGQCNTPPEVEAYPGTVLNDTNVVERTLSVSDFDNDVVTFSAVSSNQFLVPDSLITFSSDVINTNSTNSITVYIDAQLDSGKIDSTQITITANDSRLDGEVTQTFWYVVDLIPPVFTGPDSLYAYNDLGVCGAVFNTLDSIKFTDNYPGLNLFVDSGLNSGATFDVGITRHLYSITDSAGNKVEFPFQVNITDNELPIVHPYHPTVYLDPYGSITLDSNFTDSASSDNCVIDSIDMSQRIYDCSDIGVNYRSLYVKDTSDNVQHEMFRITVLDTTRPVVILKDTLMVLDKNGVILLDSNALDDGSWDNCKIVNYHLSRTEFDCDDIGLRTVRTTITDSSGNTHSKLSDILIFPTVETVDVTCANANDGRIEIGCDNLDSVKFSIDDGNFYNRSVVEGMAPGTYLLRMRSRGYVYHIGMFTINEPRPIELNISSTDNSCYHDSLWISATATGGVGGYMYSLNGGEYTPNGNFEDLTTGTYLVEAKDSNGCMVGSDTIELARPEKLILSSNSIAVNCYGGSDGIINTTATGGTGKYTFYLNGVNQGVDSTFSELSAGTYYLMVKDDNACVAYDTITVSQPTSVLRLAWEPIGTVNCGSNEDVVYGIFAQGGTEPYTYIINGDEVSSINYEALNPGTYYISVRDANGCKTSTQTITKEAVVSFGAEAHISQVISCFEGADGAILVNAFGGQPPYMYSYDGGDSYTADNNPQNLAAGNYHVKVKDDNDCSVDLGTYSINAPELLIIRIIKITDVSCKGSNDGHVLTVVDGGTQPYKYSYDGVNYSLSAPGFSGYAAGTYTVYVRDNRGCVASKAVTIAEPSQLNGNLSVLSEPQCGGSGAFVELTASGGVGPYMYSSNNGATYKSNNTFNGLGSGTYHFQIMDDNGCVYKFDTLSINAPAELELSVTLDESIQCSGDMGKIIASASQGLAPYSYSLDGVNFQSSGEFTNLSEGMYTVYAKDANGCEVASSIAIAEPIPLLMNVSKTDVSCSEGELGTIIVTASGGVAPFMYSLNGGEFQQKNEFLNLVEGVYSVQTMDAFGCLTAMQSVTIEKLGGVNLEAIDVIQVNCKGNDDGAIFVQASGGFAPYSYSIDGGNTYQSSHVFSNLGAGTWNITAKDSQGCEGNLTVTLFEPLALTLTPQLTDANCSDENGSLTILANGGTPPYSYSMDDGFNYQSNNDFINLNSGVYNLRIKDAKGCELSASITIGKEEGITDLNVNAGEIACHDGTTMVSVIATGSGIEYSMDGNNFQSLGVFTDVSAGNHTIWVKNESGCVLTQGLSLLEPEALIMNVEQTEEIACFGDSSATVDVSVTGGTAPYQYSIEGGDFQTENSFSNLTIGTFILTTRDAKGCMIEANITIVEPSALQLTYTITHEMDTANAGIIMNASGGTPPYLYGFWDDQLDSLIVDVQNPSGMVAGDYIIGALDANGCMDTARVTIEYQVGLTDIALMEYKIFPNPTTGIIRMEIESPEQVTGIQIMNAVGKVVHQANQLNQSQQFDLSSYAKGLYYMRIVTSNGIYVEKIVVQ